MISSIANDGIGISVDTPESILVSCEEDRLSISTQSWIHIAIESTEIATESSKETIVTLSSWSSKKSIRISILFQEYFSYFIKLIVEFYAIVSDGFSVLILIFVDTRGAITLK